LRIATEKIYTWRAAALRMLSAFGLMSSRLEDILHEVRVCQIRCGCAERDVAVFDFRAFISPFKFTCNLLAFCSCTVCPFNIRMTSNTAPLVVHLYIFSAACPPITYYGHRQPAFGPFHLPQVCYIFSCLHESCMQWRCLDAAPTWIFSYGNCP
jgi:hypothetical protein